MQEEKNNMQKEVGKGKWQKPQEKRVKRERGEEQPKRKEQDEKVGGKFDV